MLRRRCDAIWRAHILPTFCVSECRGFVDKEIVALSGGGSIFTLVHYKQDFGFGL